MLNRYKAEVTQRDPMTGQYLVRRTRRFKTLDRAERWLQSSLRPFTCTRYTYHRDRGWAQWGEVYDLKSRGKRLLEVEADHIEVPSVGELGVW